MSMISVKDFGAVGDGVTDDRVAVQAALNAGAGGDVFVPNGTYSLSHDPNNFWCINVPAGTTVRGESRDGAVLLLGPAINMSMSLVEVDAPDVVIRDITLDGNKANQTVNPHQAGLFARGAIRLQMRRVTSRNFRGDGFYVYVGSDDVAMYDCLATLNDRNGITLGGGTVGGTFIKSQFTANGAEQFDSESDGVNGQPINNVTISDCTFDAKGVSQDFVLTMTGNSAGIQSTGWTVVRNVINGPALALWITDVLFEGNTCTSSAGRPGIYIYRTCDRILVHRNTFMCSGDAVFDGGAVIYVIGTDPGQSPGGVVISENVISTNSHTAGVTAACVRDITVTGNVFTGPGPAAASPAMFFRATRELEPVQSVIVSRNRISGFSQNFLTLGGNGPARINRAIVTDNSVDGALGMVLNTDDDAALDVTQYGNVMTNSVSPLIVRPPNGTMVPWGDGQRWVRNP